MGASNGLQRAVAAPQMLIATYPLRLSRPPLLLFDANATAMLANAHPLIKTIAVPPLLTSAPAIATTPSAVLLLRIPWPLPRPLLRLLLLPPWILPQPLPQVLQPVLPLLSPPNAKWSYRYALSVKIISLSNPNTLSD